MKYLLLLFIFLSLSINLFSQKNIIKAGLYISQNFNNQYEIGFERLLKKQWSLEFNLGYQSWDHQYYDPTDTNAVKFYQTQFGMGDSYGSKGFKISSIIESRYYLKSNDNGVFIFIGLPFIYEKYTMLRVIRDDYTNPSEVLYETFEMSIYDRMLNLYSGLGIKQNIISNLGIELKFMATSQFNIINPRQHSFDIYLVSGLNIYYQFNKN